jgi:glycosyltransferase involved in cell wall biosynthesis
MAVASPWSRDIATGLVQLGHDVHVVDFGEAPSAAAYLSASDETQALAIEALGRSGVAIHRIPTRWRSRLRYLTAAPSVRRISHTIGADIVLTLYGGGFATLALASGVRPYSVYVVGSDVLMASGIVRPLASFALSRAGRVFANGAYLAARTRDLAPRADVRSLCIGINPDQFAPANHAIATPRAICTRGFLPVYNNQYLVEGLAARDPSKPSIPLTFVSKGPELPRVQALAGTILPPHQREAVEFLGGVSWERLTAELARSQIYVSLSSSDGTSVSLLEALATGLFPVLSDIPQNREWVDETEGNGILVPLNNARALAEALDTAAADRVRRERAATYNRQLVKERADARVNLGSLADDLWRLVTAARLRKQ